MWGSQPAVLVLCEVHCAVEGIELTVAQVLHIQQIILPPGVAIALIVALPGEVKPLRVAKFISCSLGVMEVVYSAIMGLSDKHLSDKNTLIHSLYTLTNVNHQSSLIMQLLISTVCGYF